LAYIGLKPKSSHTIKYSQPFELVLFHIIAFRIKCLKGSYYPHLLNNYLINYLIFSGLTQGHMQARTEKTHKKISRNSTYTVEETNQIERKSLPRGSP